MQAQENTSSTKIAVATYTGASTEGYFFTNELNQARLFFDKARPDVLKKYNLKDKSNLRESFRVTYTLKMVDGKERLTIINLEKLEYDAGDNGEGGTDP